MLAIDQIGSADYELHARPSYPGDEAQQGEPCSEEEDEWAKAAGGETDVSHSGGSDNDGEGGYGIRL